MCTSVPAIALALMVGAGFGFRDGNTPPLFGTGETREPRFVAGITGGGVRPDAARGYLLRGAAGDGVTDDTPAFRRSARDAAASGKPLVVPPARRCYVLTGTVVLTGSIVGRGHPCIRMVGSEGRSGHTIFKVSRYAGPGLWITGLRLDGGFDPTAVDYPMSNGHPPRSVSSPPEYSMGIALYGARNVTISDNLVANTIGDNIYLGNGGLGPNQNVLIRGNTLVNPFRCAIAFIHAKEVAVIDNVIVKIGTFVSAIDFEPNDPSEINSEIEVAYNDVTISNAPNGFPPRPTFATSNAWVVTGGRRAGPGLFLHDNFGQFGSPDIGTGLGPGFFSDNSKASSTVERLVVARNRQTRPFGTPTIAYFFALPSTIDAGQTATLNWSVLGARALEIDQGVGPVSGHEVSVSPSSSTTYALSAAASVTTKASTTITVRRELSRRPGSRDAPRYGIAPEDGSPGVSEHGSETLPGNR